MGLVGLAVAFFPSGEAGPTTVAVFEVPVEVAFDGVDRYVVDADSATASVALPEDAPLLIPLGDLFCLRGSATSARADSYGCFDGLSSWDPCFKVSEGVRDALFERLRPQVDTALGLGLGGPDLFQCAGGSSIAGSTLMSGLDIGISRFGEGELSAAEAERTTYPHSIEIEDGTVCRWVPWRDAPESGLWNEAVDVYACPPIGEVWINEEALPDDFEPPTSWVSLGDGRFWLRADGQMYAYSLTEGSDGTMDVLVGRAGGSSSLRTRVVAAAW